MLSLTFGHKMFGTGPKLLGVFLLFLEFNKCISSAHNQKQQRQVCLWTYVIPGDKLRCMFTSIKQKICSLLCFCRTTVTFAMVCEILIQKPATQVENNLIWLSRPRKNLRLCKDGTWQLKQVLNNCKKINI